MLTFAKIPQMEILQGSATAIYQKTEVDNKSVDLQLAGTDRVRLIADLLKTTTDLMSCSNLVSKLKNPVYVYIQYTA